MAAEDSGNARNRAEAYYDPIKRAEETAQLVCNGDMTTEEIIREYGITEEDIRAALAYTAELIDSEEFHPLPVPTGDGDALPR